MAGKVVHIDNEAHRLAKEYCRIHRLQMSKLISGLIKQRLNNRSPVDMKVLEIFSSAPPPKIKPSIMPPNTTLPTVEHTTLPGFETTCQGTDIQEEKEEDRDPYSRPAFWER